MPNTREDHAQNVKVGEQALLEQRFLLAYRLVEYLCLRQLLHRLLLHLKYDVEAGVGDIEGMSHIMERNPSVFAAHFNEELLQVLLFNLELIYKLEELEHAVPTSQ